MFSVVLSSTLHSPLSLSSKTLPAPTALHLGVAFLGSHGEPLHLLAPVRVLEELHQKHEGVETEEYDDGKKDPLDDNPGHPRNVLYILDARYVVVEGVGVEAELQDGGPGLLEPECAHHPHTEVHQDEEDDHLGGVRCRSLPAAQASPASLLPSLVAPSLQ